MAFADALPRIIVDSWGRATVPNGTHSAVKAGDPMTINTAVWRHSEATEDTFIMYALEDAEKGESFQVAVGAVITGFTGLVVGDALYIAGAGLYTPTAGSLEIAGYAVTATTAVVGPSMIPV